MKIPFDKNVFEQEDIKIIMDSLNSGDIGSSGKYTKKVNIILSKLFNHSKVSLTTSCTHALETSMMLLNVKERDEVIMPSYSFPSTANAAILRGAKPIFVDIERENLNIDISKIEEKINNKTKAIIPVHYAGIPCNMDKLIQIAKDNNIFVVEDAAQSLGVKYKGKYAGSLGDFGCFSFHSTKNYVSGEGGALIQNIDDEEIYDKTNIIIQKGTNRKRFLEGKVDKYTWVDIGSSYGPSDLLMAVLYTQLLKLENINKQRKIIFDIYYDNLKAYVDDSKIVSCIKIPDYCEYNYHMFYIILESEKTRNLLMNKLKERNINAYFHFMPLHTSSMGRKIGSSIQCPITEEISKTILRLPIYNSMTKEEALYTVENLLGIIKKI